MKNNNLKGGIILVITALIWGSSFVAQSEGMDSVDAFTFNGSRIIIGAISLIPVIVFSEIKKKNNGTQPTVKQRRQADKILLKRGLICGLLIFCASNLQQFAFYYSEAGKIAFVTSFYMLFVPIMGIFLKKRVPLLTWICVLLGCMGLYFLFFGGGSFGSVNKGDLLALGCAVFYAVHILCVEKYAQDTDGVKLSFMQFVVAGALSAVCMFVFEEPSVAQLRSVTVPLLYAGIGSCGIAYTCQIIGQKYASASVASVIMCLESVFGAISSAIIFHERMSTWESLGCVMMFIAVVVSQIPTQNIKMLSKKKQNRLS